MAVKVWLLGGAVTDDHIVPEMPSCWKRQDLMDVPTILAYSDTLDAESGAHISANNMGGKVVLIPYGEFESHEAVFADYNSGGAVYTSAYEAAVEALSSYIGRSLKDLDWVMPVMEGALNIQQNFCYIPDMVNENKALVGLIDCSMIYSSVGMISAFVRKMCAKKELSKYEQYQLAYYQSALQSIEKPDCYLLNKEEINVVTEIYGVWSISGAIENASSNTKQAITLFSFLSNYQADHENELMSSFLTFFGIIVGFEASYNIITVMIGGQNAIFDIIFSIAIVLILLVYMVLFCRKLINRRNEHREFTQKTSPADKRHTDNRK